MSHKGQRKATGRPPEALFHPKKSIAKSLKLGKMPVFRTDGQDSRSEMMAHRRRNGIYRWKKKKANHGRMGSIGGEKSDFRRDYRRKTKKYRKAHA